MKLSIGTFLFFASFLFMISCSDDEVVTPGGGDPMTGNETIWTGGKLLFTKDDGADPTEQANQDRLTDNVWITRGNDGGQIFNISTESESTKASSPAGTEWSIGTTSNLASLSFAPFRTAVEDPKTVVGKDLVLHLIEDDIYLDIQFTAWSTGKDGGFAYERSTP